MKRCVYCSESIAAEAALCPHCRQSQLPANHLNLTLSLSLLGLALLVALTYWALSELIWLPLTQSGFYFAIDRTSLQNYVPYWTGAIERRSFFNANWLLFGALLYIPLVTVMIMRFGPQRSAVAAFFAPLPFATLDTWSWWVRSVRIPEGVNAAEAVRPLPGILQLIGIILITGLAAALVQIAVLSFSRRIVKRYPRAALIQIQTFQPITVPALKPPAPALALPLHPYPEPSETEPVSPPIALIAEAAPSAEVALPEPIEKLSLSLSSMPSLESTAPTHTANTQVSVNPAEGFSAERVNGVPVWLIVAGLALLIVIGFVLIIIALRA